MAIARDAVLNLRCPMIVKKALVKAADENQRSISSMATFVLTQWLKEQGHLDDKKLGKKKR